MYTNWQEKYEIEKVKKSSEIHSLINILVNLVPGQFLKIFSDHKWWKNRWKEIEPKLKFGIIVFIMGNFGL